MPHREYPTGGTSITVWRRLLDIRRRNGQRCARSPGCSLSSLIPPSRVHSPVPAGISVSSVVLPRSRVPSLTKVYAGEPSGGCILHHVAKLKSRVRLAWKSSPTASCSAHLVSNIFPNMVAAKRALLTTSPQQRPHLVRRMVSHTLELFCVR